MHENGKKLLNLMFRPGEKVCVSYNKYGYHSIPIEEIEKGIVTLVPTQDSCEKRNISFQDGIEKKSTDALTLIALNPIDGYREDSNCTAFRNFLVEMDYGLLKEQLEYAKTMGLPYSAIVFSGNKSLHFLISLDQDLPSESNYRVLSEWILKIMTLADPNTKNPSRSIRIPGALREPDKLQRLVEFKGPTKLSELCDWLAKYPDAKPQVSFKRRAATDFDAKRIKPWVHKALKHGLDPTKGRNKQWFSIACEFAIAGLSEDDTINILSQYFTPDRDFKEKEWEISINSAFKHIYARK